MKRIHEVARHWRIGATLAALCALMLAGLQLTADDSGPFGPDIPDAPAVKDTHTDTSDFEGQIEISVNGGIHSRTRTDHFALVSVKNVSKEDIDGPLALVIDSPGLGVLEVAESDGKLASGEPYLELLGDDATLRAGTKLRPKRVPFTSEAAIPLSERRDFAPEFRVVRLTDKDRQRELAEDKDDENLPGKSYSQADMNRVMAIQEAATRQLFQMGHGSVYGTAVSEDDQGNLVVRVYTENPEVIRNLPGDVDGVPLDQMVIGAPFTAGPTTSNVIYVNGKAIVTPQQDKNAGDGSDKDSSDGQDGSRPGANVNPNSTGTPYDPTVRFDRPVPIGVSAFNLDIGICATGTLGCRTVDGLGAVYGLSNNHVMGGYLDVLNVALVGIPGDRIVQPGPLDALPICSFYPLDTIGRVVDYEPVFLDTPENCANFVAPINLMDACVMRSTPNNLYYCTPPDGYGAPSRHIATARIGMEVQKYGRTTVATTGTITSVNATVCVLYIMQPQLMGLFIKQIEVENTVPFGHAFGGPGDSGSLIVTKDKGALDRRPVALLFAGGPNGAVDVTIGCPIGPILTRFGLTVDDGSGAPGTGEISGSSGGVVGPVDPPPPFPM